MKNLKNLLFVALFFTSAMVLGQTKVSGTVVDETGEPLPSASVVEKGTSNGTSADFNGVFTLTTESDSGTIVVSFVGYKSIEVSFSSSKTKLGNITLAEDGNLLEEVVVVGKGVIDLAGGRKTPVAVSTIKAAEIQKKIGTQDVTMTLVNTPSVYVAGQAGGYGDSRMAVRGFEQDNTAYLLNGQPINGMEDGKMYWSNWSGINDIASAIQIQRGLGASKLAISSVGGTTNFVTKTTDKRKGGYFYGGVANDSYFKSTLFYSTGKSEKGFGTSVMFSHWQGEGYNEGTKGQGQTYFISFGYTPNETHNFNFLITGAPQWHDQNFSKNISTYLQYGRKYNNNWGTYQGEYLTERRNFYHKPVMNLNWDFKISDDTNLSTVLYGSWGRGGGTGGRGRRERTADGYIDYSAIYNKNAKATDGLGINFGNDTYITRASMNLHSWYGVVSNLETKINDNLVFNVGLDLRTYYGEHFRVVEDFHGLTSWKENIRLRDQNNNHQTYGSFGTHKQVTTTRSMQANPWDALFADFEQKDKIAYSNDERISYGGIFAQLEYATEDFSTFFQGSLSQQRHQRFDYYQYADQTLIDGTSTQATGALPAGIEDGVTSEKISNVGYNAKGGIGYNVNENSKVFANAGFYSRQPYHDNIFPAFNNQINPFSENEKILSLEAGYTYSSSNFRSNVNLYRTSWKNRVTNSSNFVGGLIQNTLGFGVEQLHQGIEIDFSTRLLNDQLRLKGFTSIGDWQYKGSAISRVQDEDQNIISETPVDVDGGKVGDAAQFTLGLGLDYNFTQDFSADIDWRYYNGLYADVGPVKTNLELPSYDIVDIGASYRLKIGEDNKSLNFRLNMNNAFNEVYLSDLRTNIVAGDTNADGTDWNGIDTANQGYFGLGRTWNFSVRYRF
ncbi:outer membrane receptor protein involved in Fe transport [Lutibacter sp. Hel_I_33_5]|uniref:TonB-dependent receptor n=1 Tax=Lutibacter sp. Hel_I_33_5 TaxID=1566289 RepID=UPI0011A8612B|nr:carboxypeptidase-like regulatory domain-containing protein [Lutibacter sp. Hel_I_33_5]TVZ56471.1 outer membrane receptor protein involved in Fe transport [Lutibacter sp. Hel_I_33_5]